MNLSNRFISVISSFTVKFQVHCVVKRDTTRFAEDSAGINCGLRMVSMEIQSRDCTTVRPTLPGTSLGKTGGYHAQSFPPNFEHGMRYQVISSTPFKKYLYQNILMIFRGDCDNFA